MVRRLLVTLLLLPVLSSATGQQRATTFEATVSSDTVEYGKAVSLLLRTSLATPRLDSLDLSSLEKDFAIETREDVEHDEATGGQRWRIRLYPRQPGKASVPVLIFQGNLSEAIPLAVTPAIDHKDKAPIRVTMQFSQTDVWLRQPVRVEMQIETAASIVALDTDTPRNSGMEIIALPLQRQPLPATKRTRHSLGWRLYPLTTGKQLLQLPPVRYQRDGVVTHRFYPPRLSLNVKPLPAYVPASMPVGKLALRVALPDARFRIRNRLDYLVLQPVGDVLPGQSLPALLRQFRSNETVKFYPARPESTGSSPAWRIPFVVNRMGLINLPDLRLQYFDPDTGKLQTRHYATGRILVLSQWLVYSIYIALTIGLLLLLRTGVRKLRHRLYRYRKYRLAARTLQRARQPEEFRTALTHMAQAEGWPANLSLQRWLEYWQSRNPGNVFLHDPLLRLQAWCYAGQPADPGELRSPLLQACYRRAPLLRLFG